MVAQIIWWLLGLWFVDVIAVGLFNVSPIALIHRFFRWLFQTPYDKEVHRSSRTQGAASTVSRTNCAAPLLGRFVDRSVPRPHGTGKRATGRRQLTPTDTRAAVVSPSREPSCRSR